MKKKSLVPLLGIAFVVAIVSTGVFYGLFVGKLRSADSAAASGPRLLVAAHAITRGAALKRTDVRAVPWGGGALPAGALTDAKEVEGWTALEALAENEPVLRARLGQKGKSEGGGMGIPAGKRAVSVHAYDSAGVLNLLKPGHRVDVQVIGGVDARGYGTSMETQLRTVLENVEVLAVDRQPENIAGRGPAPVVTLLATPKEAAVLGLADSTARIRLALRNPLDDAKGEAASLGLAALFRGQSPQTRAAGGGSAPSPGSSTASTAGQRDGQVELWVRLAGAGEAALEELKSRMSLPGAGAANPMEVAALRFGQDTDRTIEKLEREKLLEVLGATRLLAGSRRDAGFEAGTEWKAQPGGFGVRIQFTPTVRQSGRLRLRVHPEVTAPREGGAATRRIETEIEIRDGQTLLVSGLASPGDVPALWERLFPGRGQAPEAREFVVLVTGKLVRSGSPVALRTR